MKPFDLEAAKKGARLITEDMHFARIICWDLVDYYYTLVGVVMDDGVEHTVYYDSNGKSPLSQLHDYSLDLMMLSDAQGNYIYD